MPNLTNREYRMGLIRKSLAVGTMGAVRGSSKKQRVAKGQLRELKAQTALQKQQAAAEATAARAAAAPFVPPAAGWFPHPEREDLMRWWDGQAWTDQTAPRG